MVAVNQQAQQQSKRFDIWQALKDLEFVTTFFTWLFRLMARLAEPLMTLSTIYVIVEAGVPSVSVNWLHWLAVGIMISAPEVILPGGFILANELHTQGNKRSWVLYAMCWIFVVLTAGTLADLFIWHFQGAALSTLMWVRCAAAVGYSVLFRVITYKQEKEVLPITDVLERFQAFTESLNGLSEKVNEVRAETENRVNDLTQKVHESQRAFTFSLNELTNELTSALPEKVNANVNSVLQTQFTPILATLDAHAQMLDALAVLPASIEGLEQMTSSQLEVVVKEVKATISKSQSRRFSAGVNTLIVNEVPPVNNLQLTSPVDLPSELPSDGKSDGNLKRSFIVEQLTRNPEIRNSDIVRLAQETGLEISPAYVSIVRKSLQEEVL